MISKLKMMMIATITSLEYFLIIDILLNHNSLDFILMMAMKISLKTTK
jgi:hypothetical protein